MMCGPPSLDPMVLSVTTSLVNLCMPIHAKLHSVHFALVNGVVFVTTNAAALYAFDTLSGKLLWQANDLGTPPRGSQAADIVNIGPAVYGNYVVIGTGASKLHIYTF